MHGPAVVSWLLVAMCGATGLYCLRAARAPGAVPGATRLEGVMGLGMAAMAMPGLSGRAPAAAFVVLFGGLAAWALWSARPGHGGARIRRAGDGERHAHRAHGLHHAVEALAMAYMAAVMLGASGQHAGHGGAAGGTPWVTGGLLVYFALFALRTGARAPYAAVATGAGTPGLQVLDVRGLGGGADTGADTPGGRTAGMADACRLTLALGSFTMLLSI